MANLFMGVCTKVCGAMVLRKVWNIRTTPLMNILENQFHPTCLGKFCMITWKVSIFQQTNKGLILPIVLKLTEKLSKTATYISALFRLPRCGEKMTNRTHSQQNGFRIRKRCALHTFIVFTLPFPDRWSKNNLRHWISFNHVVRHVTYNDATDDFSVVVKNLTEDRVLLVRKFDYVIVATGHFSVPNIPSFPGIEEFPGRVLHSHTFRNASHFQDKKVLAVGSSLSAEDIALKCHKYGAKSIVCTWKTKPMGFSFPPQITERPLPTNIEGNTIHFKDGTSTEVDDIILCTRYRFYDYFAECEIGV